MVATDSPAVRGVPGRDDAGITVSSDPSSAQPATALDGAAFRDLLIAGLAWLDRHHEIVNALNVFPVPDGDTGTNMLLTMKSACQEIGPESLQSVGAVAKSAAHGALMGARGNSGVILSQILRGMARSLDGQSELAGPGLAAALTEGNRVAYKGVNKPVEGTILTVVREAAVAAEEAANAGSELGSVLKRALDAADVAVANTPKLLPVLAQAGKVDSGGKGLFYILEGMYRSLQGETLVTEAETAPALVTVARPSKGQREIPALVYGFDVQFLLEGSDLDVDQVRADISAMGDCPLVEGDQELIKVHVHVPNPGVALGYAVSHGFVTDVVVENMDDMHLPEMPAGYDPIPPRFESDLGAEKPGLQQPIEGPGIVAVVPGAGLAQVFRSLGAHRVVAGGQTMNPSTHDLLEAIEKVASDQVILLPNNGNVIMAAQQARILAEQSPETAGKQIVVVPSKTIPQGISALLSVNTHTDLDRNVQAMTSALGHVRTGEVTVAVQDASFDGIIVHAGDMIGLLDDVLTTKGEDSAEVVMSLLEQMNAGELEVITLYYGQPVNAHDAAELQRELAEVYADQEIEIVGGGQPYYHYIISAE